MASSHDSPPNDVRVDVAAAVSRPHPKSIDSPYKEEDLQSEIESNPSSMRSTFSSRAKELKTGEVLKKVALKINLPYRGYQNFNMFTRKGFTNFVRKFTQD